MWSNWGRKIRPIIFDLFRPICNMSTNWSNAYFRPNFRSVPIRPICSGLDFDQMWSKMYSTNYFFDQMVLYLFLMGHSRPLFLFSVFSKLKCSWHKLKVLPMTGFDLRISGVGSDRSADCASTTALHRYLIYLDSWCIQCIAFLSCLILKCASKPVLYSFIFICGW